MKDLLKLGKILSKVEQKEIQGARRPFIGSGCAPSCPSTCASLGGRCVPCSDVFGAGEECRIFRP
ncbi:hypothetical protein ACFO3O_13445 [Dokdonia ponticola]|uniref:Bacteriocin n=1 Tax=Dokdonia ponticola TaxID=2041041 RepID=A0ABV9HXM6_9FLAO